MSDYNTVDVMISASANIIESMDEYMAMGCVQCRFAPCHEIVIELFGEDQKPSVTELMAAICVSEKSIETKIFTLEGIACDLSEVAKDMGYLKR